MTGWSDQDEAHAAALRGRERSVSGTEGGAPSDAEAKGTEQEPLLVGAASRDNTRWSAAA
jgi:hypothetical protein